MYIPNDDAKLALFYTQLNKPTNHDSMKDPKVVEPTNKKTLL